MQKNHYYGNILFSKFYLCCPGVARSKEIVEIHRNPCISASEGGLWYFKENRCGTVYFSHSRNPQFLLKIEKEARDEYVSGRCTCDQPRPEMVRKILFTRIT